jgi:hypothetical protein
MSILLCCRSEEDLKLIVKRLTPKPRGRHTGSYATTFLPMASCVKYFQSSSWTTSAGLYPQSEDRKELIELGLWLPFV